jgi:hypothetical protein
MVMMQRKMAEDASLFRPTLVVIVGVDKAGV